MSLLTNSIKYQVPEFVRADYPEFIEFMEAYFEFLESQKNSVLETRDLMSAADKFVELMKQEVSTNLPTLVADERIVVSRLREFYRSKGSLASFEFLFKVVFGKNVQIHFPSTQLLKPSDGKWIQENSMIVEVIYGDVSKIVGRSLDVIDEGNDIRVKVERVEAATELGGNLYELFVDKRFFGKFSVGDVAYNDDKTFKALIKPTLRKASVQKKGSGFRKGQLYNVLHPNGEGTILKVKDVDSNGGLKTVDIIKFGQGYTADFVLEVYPSNKSIEDGRFYDGSPNGWPDQNKVGQIKFTVGEIAKYPGYFATNDGFISDDIRIQDSKYYQTYSYVVKISERLDSYKPLLKALVHPAGFALFGSYDIENKFDLLMSFKSLVDKKINKFLLDEVSVASSISKHTTKPLPTSPVSVSSLLSKTTSKKFSSGASFTDSGSVSVVSPYMELAYMNDVYAYVEGSPSTTVTF